MVPAPRCRRRTSHHRQRQLLPVTPLGSDLRCGIRHPKRTRPRRPQTNGKVERFHRILLEEWAYIRDWTSENERVAGYDAFMHFYNQHRSHGALGWSTPMATLTRIRDNVPVMHI